MGSARFTPSMATKVSGRKSSVGGIFARAPRELREIDPDGLGLRVVPDDPAAVGRAHPRPRPRVERLARGGDRELDVALVAPADLRARLLGRGIDGGVGLAGDRRTPATPDEELSGVHGVTPSDVAVVRFDSRRRRSGGT